MPAALATIDVTETDLTTALRGFLLSMLGDIEVIKAQVNRVASPTGPYVEMTPMTAVGMSTNRQTFDPDAGTQGDSRSTSWACQLDFYGDGAFDNASLVATMVRSSYACTFLATYGFGMQPLYAGDPHQTSMINGEQQYEDRWTMDFTAQYNPTITTPMQFAASLDVGVVEVSTAFPPGA